jgi:hypothetical protein
MLNFENISIGSLIQRNTSILNDKIMIDKRDIERIVRNQNIRCTKKNIEGCTEQIKNIVIESLKNSNVEVIDKSQYGNIFLIKE